MGGTALAFHGIGIDIIAIEAIERSHQVGSNAVGHVGKTASDVGIAVARASIGADGDTGHGLDTTSDDRRCGS
ncbi:hypothetical protein D3C87_2126300 [compost metagenome]